MPDINKTDLVARLRALNETYGFRSDPLGYCAGFCREAANTIEAQAAEISRLRDALKPFATVGKIIDGPFGPALFAEDDQAFKSGCAWTENGETKTLTWGQFRRARTALEANHGRS